MKALITGASSGIGTDIARCLAKSGHDLILVARRKERLESLAAELGEEFGINVEVIPMDLCSAENCMALYKAVENKSVDIVINNAGFGLLGRFVENDLDRELSMIDLNIRAMHILTKLFLQSFYSKGKGKILNVASIGGYMPGPLLATYYATKAYVVSLTHAIREEVRKDGLSDSIYVGCLCPGPVNTEFSDVANVRFSLSGKSSQFVAEHAVKMMFKGKAAIFPGIDIKFLAFASRLLSNPLLARISYNVQHKKYSR